MNKKIIIIDGYLASGKSTFALQVSKALHIPYLLKDTFKMAMCENMVPVNREESSRFSTAAFDAMMYVTERMFEAGYPIIIEGNFVPAGVKKVDESGIIRQLITRYGYTSLTFKFAGDTHVLHERFLAREKTPERGQANTVGTEVSYDLFDKWCHNLDKFDVGGKIIEVDTTDFNTVNFHDYAETAARFLKESV